VIGEEDRGAAAKVVGSRRGMARVLELAA